MRRFTPKYDDKLAEDMFAFGRRMNAIQNNMPKWKRELTFHKTHSAATRKNQRRRDDVEQVRQAREKIEAEAAATFKRCVAALAMALDAMNGTPAPNKYQSHINQHALVNLLHVMRTKCGVRFGEDHEPTQDPADV